MSGRGWSKRDRQSFADRDVLRASSVPSKRAQGPSADEWADEGHTCAWFALCANDTRWAAFSEVLGAYVPICDRCADRVGMTDRERAEII